MKINNRNHVYSHIYLRFCLSIRSPEHVAGFELLFDFRVLIDPVYCNRGHRKKKTNNVSIIKLTNDAVHAVSSATRRSVRREMKIERETFQKKA